MPRVDDASRDDAIGRTAAPYGRIAVIFVGSAHPVMSHAAASSSAAGANGSATGYFRGRPLGRL